MEPEPSMKSLRLNNNILSAGWMLAITALLGTALMVVVNWHSQPYIKVNERQVLLKTLNTLIPASMYDNDIVNDTVLLQDMDLLGSENDSLIYRARKNNNPVAAVMTIIAPDGYTGPIALLVGVNYAGTIQGVRVVKHRETPGLGDAIDIERGDWILSFNGKSLSNPQATGWKVKRDGGEFDQLTGATITPRAIVQSVHKALRFYRQHRSEIFYIEPTTTE